MKYLRIIAAAVAAVLVLACFSCVRNEPGSIDPDVVTPEEKPQKYTATEEEMKEATDKTVANQLMRGIWVTPRMKVGQTQEEYDAEYKKLKEAGVNMIYTYGETSSKKMMEKTLNACETNGIKVMINLSRISKESEIKGNLKLVETYDSHPSVIGYNMFDEPNTNMFELLGKEYAAIREICSEDKIIMINFFPNYASNAQLGVEESENPYRAYVDKYFELADSDIVSFDYYPYRAKSSQDEKNYAGGVANMCEIIKAANDRNRAAWGFVQCGEWSGTRTPKLGELRFLSHFHLLFGLKSFTYFLYVTPINGETDEGFFKGMVEYDGTIRDTYYLVQQTTTEIDGMKGVYLDYNFRGIIQKNVPQSWKEKIIDEFDLGAFAPVNEITCSRDDSGVLCGCFEKDSGDKGLYLLNTDFYYNLSATVKFEKIVEYKLWGQNGIEQMGASDEITVEFASGEGKFLEIIDK